MHLYIDCRFVGARSRRIREHLSPIYDVNLDPKPGPQSATTSELGLPRVSAANILRL